MFDRSSQTVEVAMPAGVPAVGFGVITPSDDIAYANGRMRARLVSRSDYRIDSTQSVTDWETVVDDDIVNVTISSASQVREGASVSVTLTRVLVAA